MVSYFGIFKNGQHIEQNNLEYLLTIDEFEYLFRCERNPDVYNTPPTFIPINRDNTYRRIIVGHFAVLSIEEEVQSNTDLYRKKVTLKDERTAEIFQLNTYKKGICFFCEELLPHLEKLNSYGSWAQYRESEEYTSKQVID